LPIAFLFLRKHAVSVTDSFVPLADDDVSRFRQKLPKTAFCPNCDFKVIFLINMIGKRNIKLILESHETSVRRNQSRFRQIRPDKSGLPKTPLKNPSDFRTG
jgi:hypothetical protein